MNQTKQRDSNTNQNMKMIITKFRSDRKIKSLAIEINGRGADFYSDGSYYAWQEGDGMFNRCEQTNNLTPYVSRNAVKEAFSAAEKELSVNFQVGTIGVYVDEDGNVDPLNEIGANFPINFAMSANALA
jgi:hypothetical protein